MLEPQSRAAFADELKPPTGYELSQAVGTTFTLDLATALSVPLSFASRQMTSDDDSVNILAAIRRCADRIDVFAQAGEIRLGRDNALTSLLETMVHPVALKKRGGLFHPKVWFLEYQSEDDFAYRFLCASRNLTDDRSWDILLRLDGNPVSRPNEETRAQNEPLVRLLRTLPKLAVNPVGSQRTENIRRLAKRIKNVEWDTIDGQRPTFHLFDGHRKYDLGIEGTDALIISPFVTDDGLANLRSSLRGRTRLISRADQLDRLAPAHFDTRMSTYVLNDAAIDLEDVDDGESPAATALTGLHAKALIIHGDHRARVIVGSANATDNAFQNNMEMMVEFTLSQSTYGINTVLDNLSELIFHYETDGGEEATDDEKAQFKLETLTRDLARARFFIHRVDESPHALRVWADGTEASRAVSRATTEKISIQYRLLSSRRISGHSLPVSEEAADLHKNVELADITPFIEVTVRDEKQREHTTFVLATILGDLPDRRDAMIARQLVDPASFMRFLILMLELSGNGIAASVDSLGSWNVSTSSSLEELALLEPIVGAVEASHRGLDEVKRIIDFVRRQDCKDPENAIIPAGFDELWRNAWEAHRMVQRTGAAD